MPKNKVLDIFGEEHSKGLLAKPFVKWAGGKGNLIPQLESLLPHDFDSQKDVTYIEPFVGGGAMLFHMLKNHRCITKAVINDINSDLIHCYDLIAHNPQVLIDRLSIIELDFYNNDVHERRDLFYAYREQYNNENNDPDGKAALFIFLNHTCFNGLYRVNADGRFNVPYGRYKKPIICNKDLIMADHDLLSSVELVIRPGDYKLTRQNLSRHNTNFVYFDPPYRPLNGASNFKEYSNHPFEDEQQMELKRFCDTLSRQNCLIMQSNSDSKNDNGDSFFEGLYEGYHFQRIFAPRYINANPQKRNKLKEIVIMNYNH